MKAITQSKLGRALGRDQSWVSRRMAEGMPCDLEKAKAWCESNGIPLTSSAPEAREMPLLGDAEAVHVDARLKEVRRRHIELRVEQAKQALISADWAADDDRMMAACERERIAVGRARVRRLLAELPAAAVAMVAEDLESAWGDLERRADPAGTLRGVTRAVLRPILLRRVDAILEEVQTSAELTNASMPNSRHMSEKNGST